MSFRKSKFGRRTVLGWSTASLGWSAASLLPGNARAQAFDPPPLPSGQTRSVKIAVGAIADVTHLAVWNAKYGGLLDALKAQGIQAEVVPFGGGSEWLLALTSGQVQMAHGYYENGVRARSQGRDVVLIDNILPTPAFQVVVCADKAGTIKSVKDAKGATWGFTSFGSASHVVSVRIAKHFGLAPTDVHWIGVGGSAGYLPSIRDKRVDILTCSLQASQQLIQEGSGKLLQDVMAEKSVEEIYGHPYLGPGLLTTNAYAVQEPFVTLRMTATIRKSIAECRAMPAAAIAKRLPAEFQGDSLVEAVAGVSAAFAPDGEIPLATAVAMCQDMSDLKFGKNGLDPATTFDNRFIRAVNGGA